MRNFYVLFLGLISTLAMAQTNRQLANKQLAYYGAEFYTSKVTKASLYKILNECHTIVTNSHDTIATSCGAQSYKQISVGYDGARKIMFGELFIKTDSQGNFVQDVYCGKKFYFQTVADVSNMHTEVNIEHTWPQSKFNGNFDKNMQKSDMHHLYPTDSDANNKRANHEFGDLAGNVDQLNVQNCSISKFGRLSDHFIFTPPTAHRGNVARSLFYFATRYNLTIGTAEEMILRQWHKVDPIDAEERTRHEIIAKYQKVRNPFVDYPELVERISDF